MWLTFLKRIKMVVLFWIFFGSYSSDQNSNNRFWHLDPDFCVFALGSVMSLWSEPFTFSSVFIGSVDFFEAIVLSKKARRPIEIKDSYRKPIW